MEKQIRLSLNILEEVKDLRQRMDRIEGGASTVNEADNGFLKGLPCSSAEDLIELGKLLEEETGKKTLLVSCCPNDWLSMLFWLCMSSK